MAELKDKERGNSNNCHIIHLIHTRVNRASKKLISHSHTPTQDRAGLNKPVNRTILNLNILIHSTLDLQGQDHRLTMEQKHNLRTLIIHSTLRMLYLKASKILKKKKIEVTRLKPLNRTIVI